MRKQRQPKVVQLVSGQSLSPGQTSALVHLELFRTLCLNLKRPSDLKMIMNNDQLLRILLIYSFHYAQCKF